MIIVRTRLSAKAQQAASDISSSFDQAVRDQASILAQSQGKEFANEADVQEGFRLVILKYAEKVGSAVQVTGDKPEDKCPPSAS